MRFPTSQQPSPGLGFGQDIAVMLSPATVAIGDCLSVDFTILDSSLRWTTMRQVATADFVTASGVANAQCYQAIAIDPATVAGTKIRCIFRGVPPSGASVTPNTVAGTTRLQPTGGAAALATAGAAVGTGNKVVAIALQAVTGPAIAQVIFNGIEGFGVSITNTT